MHAYGVTHRDLKPQNVILGAQGPQLIDFGIARGVGATELTQDGQAPGTPGYTAPEVLLKGETGAAADVFALGATLAYAPRGVRRSAPGWRRRWLPAVHEPVDVLGVEPGLAALIEACVAKTPPRARVRRSDPAVRVRDALVDDPVYTALGALGNRGRCTRCARRAGYRTSDPGRLSRRGPVRRRAAARLAVALCRDRSTRAGGLQLLPLDGGGDGTSRRGVGQDALAEPAAPAGPAGPRSLRRPLRQRHGNAVASTRSQAPARTSRNNRSRTTSGSRRLIRRWPPMAFGQCNQPAEQKPPARTSRPPPKSRGTPRPSRCGFKYAEMKPTKPDPYYVSVAVRSPHDLDLETGKPFKMDNKSVGFTSKPIDILRPSGPRASS